jgi:hypothetical protein
MLRVVVMVAWLAAFFSAAVFFGGDAVGAWDHPRIAPDTPDRAKKDKPKRAGSTAAEERRSKRETKRETRRAAAKARWAARVDALCLRASREMAGMSRPTTVAQGEAYLLRVERMNRRLNDEFAALEPPRALAGDARRVVALLRRDERLVAQLLAASRSRDATRMAHVVAALQETAGLESALLIALGAKRCDAGLSPYATERS